MTMARHDIADLPDEPQDIALRPRNVKFDWSNLPMHYVNGDAFATHWVNVMHILLPEGERWFIRVFAQALPLIRDDKLREAVIGFMGQEAVHASAHQGAQDHLAASGIDTDGFVRHLERFFSEHLGDRDLTGDAAHEWLLDRLALIASIEHSTAMLGDWILNATHLDELEVDPTMLDLLRWHGAEEVEHRSVAYDLYMHLDGDYRRRVRSHILILPALVLLWAEGIRHLMGNDPTLLNSGLTPRWRDWSRAASKDLLPSPRHTVRTYRSYLRRNFHPSQEFSTSQAVAYLAGSQAALAAMD